MGPGGFNRHGESDQHSAACRVAPFLHGLRQAPAAQPVLLLAVRAAGASGLTVGRTP
jgi:hypothetical protein